MLGFDTETKPTFRKGKVNSPALLQLAGGESVYIFQLRKLPEPSSLAAILSAPSILKVGVAVRDDLIMLKRVFPFEGAGFVDLAEVVREYEIRTAGLRNMTANFLGFRISKNAQCSNWARESLTAKQIAYAATDAWVSREIHIRLDRLVAMEQAESS